MMRCPNCRPRVPDGHALCPFCGTDLATESVPIRSQQGATSNGAIAGGVLMVGSYYVFGGAHIIAGNMLFAARHGMRHVDTGYWSFWRTADVWLGFGLPLLVTGLLCPLLRRRFPAFARGLGYSFLAALAVALGAPFLCGSPR